MRIGILQCGHPPPSLTEKFGDYGRMVGALFDPHHEVAIFDATGPGLPQAVEACDAYVLTGSSAGVYDHLPWIAPLSDFVRSARGRAKLVGICFGHQLMAEAFGGQVVKAPQGWGIGIHRYALRHQAAWMDDGESVAVPASHQDQVVVPPPGAAVVAHSPFTRFAGLDYGDAVSFQFHPEFTADFGVALIGMRREAYGALGEAAIASYAAPHDGRRVAGWIGRFLDMPTTACQSLSNCA